MNADAPLLLSPVPVPRYLQTTSDKLPNTPWNITHKAQRHYKPGTVSWFVNPISFLSVMGVFSAMR